LAPDAEHHFSCAATAVLIRPRAQQARARRASSAACTKPAAPRTAAYLEDITNWVAYEEVIALWRAGAARDGRHHGSRATPVRTRCAGSGTSATSTVLRTLGSPEALLEQIGVASHRFSVASTLEARHRTAGARRDLGVREPRFPRNALACQWTAGLLSQATALFGLQAAHVVHPACQVEGAPACRYELTWDPSPSYRRGRPGPPGCRCSSAISRL
jgi:hypothetical protein